MKLLRRLSLCRTMHSYDLFTNNGEEHDLEEPFDISSASSWRESTTLVRICNLFIVVGFIFAVLAGFAAGVFYTKSTPQVRGNDVFPSTATRIPLPTVQRKFVYSSPFSKRPPHGPGSGAESEPIWDALIPNGLGYFKDGHLAPQPSIPTAFHQLHCLYILRRAYYSQSDDLQEFDFGKNRTVHAAHCFDYLLQSLTCSADSTVEPAIGREHEFLGSGFQRQCRDFNTLKKFVEEWRVFNASGFLALGLDHGHAHIHNTL
ncbi:hypothetical protein F5B20DRAFT_543764 [Whalleya microplaca]|nr:hypothetical protein F5B20DRAFT_543764 [Whalleya microplaca]